MAASRPTRPMAVQKSPNPMRSAPECRYAAHTHTRDTYKNSETKRNLIVTLPTSLPRNCFEVGC